MKAVHIWNTAVKFYIVQVIFRHSSGGGGGGGGGYSNIQDDDSAK